MIQRAYSVHRNDRCAIQDLIVHGRLKSGGKTREDVWFEKQAGIIALHRIASHRITALHCAVM